MEGGNIKASSKPSMKKLVPMVAAMASNWYELGAMLLEEKEETQLQMIESTHGSNVKKCCVAMLKYWIDKHPEATWHQLVTALKSSGVDLNALASSIEGNYTVEVADNCDQSPTVINFAECQNVVDAFAMLTALFIKELSTADFETIKIICLPRADKPLKNKIRRTTDIKSFFELLTNNPLYFNWMNVEYLRTMAIAAGNKMLQSILGEYTDTVLSKTLGEVWNSMPSFQKSRTKYYNEIRAKFRGENPDAIKVQDLQNRRPGFAQKIAVHIMRIVKGSLTITWSILAEETYQAYLLALNIPQELRTDDFLQIGAWVVFHPQLVMQELKKLLAMMTTQSLLMSYYHDLLLRELSDTDWLADKMCSAGLLTDHEQAMISSGHSMHQRNSMLLEYTRHMDVQALESFCTLVQEMWPQVGSQLITALKCEGNSSNSVVTTSEVIENNMEVPADMDLSSPTPKVHDTAYCESLPLNFYFFNLIDRIAQLLRFYQLKLVRLCETLKASEVYDINLFSVTQIKELGECNNTVLLFVKLSTLITWSNHSILRELASCCHEAVKLLDEFDSKVNADQQITSLPIPNLSRNMIPSDTSTYTILAVRCKVELYKCSLQYVYDVRSVMIEKCDITQHCLQLLAVRGDPTILYWTIPKCVVDLINTNVPLHSEYLYSRGLLEVLVYPNLLLTTSDDVCYGSLAFECGNQSFSEKVADLVATNQRNEAMLKHVRLKYDRLLNEYEENKRYTAMLENNLKKEEKNIPNDEHRPTTQENQTAIREATDKEKLPHVESDLEFELAKKQKHNEELNKENTDLRVTINALREEVNEKDSSIKVEQLQKQNANLQYLVNKYKKLEHTQTISTCTQTDEEQRKILCPGMKGVIVTCNGMEKSCAIEACKLLSEFADRLYVPEVQSYATDTDDTTLESDAAASQELKELNEKPFQKKRFQSVECGARNVVFIQCQEASICPSDLIHYMLTNIKTSGIPSTRYKYSLCMLPVTHTCRAFQNDIIKCAKEVLAPYFHIPDKTLQFAVVYKSRNNSGLIKDDIILWMVETANKGTTYNHKVNLKSPDLVILVEIIKNVCCMSVVTDFYKLKKYNIQELTMSAAAKQEN